MPRATRKDTTLCLLLGDCFVPNIEPPNASHLSPGTPCQIPQPNDNFIRDEIPDGALAFAIYFTMLLQYREPTCMYATYLEGNALRGLAGVAEGHGALGRRVGAVGGMTSAGVAISGQDELQGRLRRHLQSVRGGGHRAFGS